MRSQNNIEANSKVNDWLSRYRPRTFGDVYGQGGVIAQLKQIIRTGERRSLVFDGASGTGKTTLARIYAKALQCLSPTDDGSPCGACFNCLTFDDPGRFAPDVTEVSCPNHGNKDDIEYYLEKIGAAPAFGNVHIIHFDEAQGLTASSSDLLLIPLERENNRPVFVFTLIDRMQLTKPLLNRCRCFNLTLPESNEAISYLKRICAEESLTCTTEALELIASVSHDYRSLTESLFSLTRATTDQHIDDDLVRSILLRDRTKGISDYLLAVCRADLQAQLDIIDGLNLTPLEKADSILRVLLVLRLSHVRPYLLKLKNRATALLLSDIGRADLISEFSSVAERKSVALSTLFNQMLEFWTFHPSDLTATKLDVVVTHFNDALNGDVSLDAVTRSTKVDKPKLFAPKRRFRSVGQKTTAGSQSAESEYLTLEQVRSIYEAATFMLQEYGVAFNARLEFQHGVLNTDGTTSSRLSTSQVHQKLRQIAERGSQDGADLLSHRISLLTWDSTIGHVTTSLLYIPAARIGRIRNFVRRLHEKSGGVAEITILPDARNRRLAFNRHWTMIRSLWSGVDPKHLIMSGSEERFLYEALGVQRSQLKAAGRLALDRYSISDSIGRSAQSLAARDRMAHLSAMMDGAWMWVGSGWELQEHLDRKAERGKRAEAIRRTTERFDVDDPLSQKALEEHLAALRDSWPIDPHKRSRSRALWF